MESSSRRESESDPRRRNQSALPHSTSSYSGPQPWGCQQRCAALSTRRRELEAKLAKKRKVLGEFKEAKKGRLIKEKTRMKEMEEYKRKLDEQRQEFEGLKASANPLGFSHSGTRFDDFTMIASATKSEAIDSYSSAMPKSAASGSRKRKLSGTLPLDETIADDAFKVPLYSLEEKSDWFIRILPHSMESGELQLSTAEAGGRPLLRPALALLNIVAGAAKRTLRERWAAIDEKRREELLRQMKRQRAVHFDIGKVVEEFYLDSAKMVVTLESASVEGWRHYVLADTLLKHPNKECRRLLDAYRRRNAPSLAKAELSAVTSFDPLSESNYWTPVYRRGADQMAHTDETELARSSKGLANVIRQTLTTAWGSDRTAFDHWFNSLAEFCTGKHAAVFRAFIDEWKPRVAYAIEASEAYHHSARRLLIDGSALAADCHLQLERSDLTKWAQNSKQFREKRAAADSLVTVPTKAHCTYCKWMQAQVEDACLLCDVRSGEAATEERAKRNTISRLTACHCLSGAQCDADTNVALTQRFQLGIVFDALQYLNDGDLEQVMAELSQRVEYLWLSVVSAQTLEAEVRSGKLPDLFAIARESYSHFWQKADARWHLVCGYQPMNAFLLQSLPLTGEKDASGNPKKYCFALS